MTLLPWKRAARETGPQANGFADLALPLLPSLYNVAFWLSRNPADAEDLVQETFLKALRGFATFEAGSNFKAWIFRILRNTYLLRAPGWRRCARSRLKMSWTTAVLCILRAQSTGKLRR